jgi:3-oxoacyl-[acyl-carrier protein] reductase
MAESSLRGKVALVTGASSGLGRSFALALAAAGAKVFLAARREEKLREVVEAILRAGGEAAYHVVDVRVVPALYDLVDVLLARFKRLDILVNNAGVIKDALFPFMKEEDWDYVVDVDLKGAFRVTRALIRGMLHKSYGRIVNVVSVSGISGHAGQANYSAAKGGLIAFTKALALEFAPRGITVNAVAPGLVDTEIIAHLKEEARREFIGRIPMARFGTPEEIAAVVGFLASEKASYVTGQVWRADGGMA